MGSVHDILEALEASCIEVSRTKKPKGAIEWSWRDKLYDNVFKIFPGILDQGDTDFCLFCAVVFAAQMELHGYKHEQGEAKRKMLEKKLIKGRESIYVYTDAVPWCFKHLGVKAEIDHGDSDAMVQNLVNTAIDHGDKNVMVHGPVMGNSGGKKTSALDM